uniref:Exopolysaccharide synthesis ExoD n=1 Tax=Cyanothece sp. (strain PCC 7425 / ATCC 29141) TaxID=395961 RepID=B8HK83_CYAP4
MNGLNTWLISLPQATETSNQTLRVSQLLEQFLVEHQQEEVCLRDILVTLGDRSFGPTLIICALPLAIPLPLAGISALVSVPLILVSGQLVLGFEQPWLPDPVLNQNFKRDHIEHVINTAIPLLQQLEAFCQPRLPFFTSPAAERGVGLVLVLLGVIIALPIPFGNMLPAIAIVLICLGLIEKDGLIIAISGLMGTITPALLLLFL